MIPCEECISRALCITHKEDHDNFGPFFVHLLEQCPDFKQFTEDNEDLPYEEQVQIIIKFAKLFKWYDMITLTNDQNEVKQYEVTM